MSQHSRATFAQPFTFEGVAAFGRASVRRLLLWQFVLALLSAGAVVTCFQIAWCPVIQRAILALPNDGSIQHRALHWPFVEPFQPPGSSFLTVQVDPTGTLEMSPGADLQVKLGPSALTTKSLLGFARFPYPAGYSFALNRTELEPWWGAWRVPIELSLGFAVFLGLFVSWNVLALIYAWPVRFIAFYADRELSWTGAWRVASAALLPGALFFSIAILGYAFQDLKLIQLLLAGGLHLIIGFAYLLASPFCLPQVDAAPPEGGSSNPFHLAPPAGPKNPFSSPAENGEQTRKTP